MAEAPTQEAPFGIRFDFNQGARIRLPERSDDEWLIRLKDLDTGNVLFESRTQGGANSWSLRATAAPRAKR
ncbi:MAG: hypothetical protein JO111_13970 [Caulobacteraceae bacterium]|nr:hypothetical protein [Caulobacteraceae bacterium]